MSCEKCKELLWEFLAQELSEGDVDFVAAHLEQCPSCQEEAAQLQKIMESLKNLPEEELPEGYHNELMEKLAQETKVLPLPVRKKPQYKWKRFSLIAAAALLVVAVGGAQGILSLRGNQNEVVQEMIKEDEKGIDNDVVGYTVVSQEDGIIAEDRDEEQVENTASSKEVESQQEKIGVPQTKAIQGEPKAEQKLGESLPKIESQKAETPETISNMQEDSTSPLLRSEPRGITYTLTSEDTAPEVLQQIILTVENKEGILDSIRNLAISLGGYEVAQAVLDTIEVSVPSEKAEEFMDGLKKLGETRSIEISTESTDAVIFEVTLELK